MVVDVVVIVKSFWFIHTHDDTTYQLTRILHASYHLDNWFWMQDKFFFSFLTIYSMICNTRENVKYVMY